MSAIISNNMCLLAGSLARLRAHGDFNYEHARAPRPEEARTARTKSAVQLRALYLRRSLTPAVAKPCGLSSHRKRCFNAALHASAH